MLVRDRTLNDTLDDLKVRSAMTWAVAAIMPTPHSPTQR